MSKILGLDLGTNSIGWSIRNLHDTENQIEKAGVITFETGVGRDKTGDYSYAAERTKKRSVRRLYQARKYRLWDTLEVLINLGYCPMTIEELDKWRCYDKEKGLKRMYPTDAVRFEQWIRLDFDGDGVADYSSPYQLRSELAQEKFNFELETDRYKLGRALYHIAQRRGFKSSRKASKDAEKEEKQADSSQENLMAQEEVNLQRSELKKNYSLEKKFSDFKESPTIGVFLAKREKDGQRIRKELMQYLIRQNFKDEIKHIFEFQGLGTSHELYLQTVEKTPNKNDGTIFYKRPLRSQKGGVGICTLERKFYHDKKEDGKVKIIETGKKRCSVSHPVFEEFRAWSFLNNIKYRKASEPNDKFQPIPIEDKKTLYKQLFFRKTKPEFKFEDISSFYKKRGDDIVLNYKDKTNISACPVTARLKEIFDTELSGIELKNTKIVNPIESQKDFSIEEIWHVLFTFEDQEMVEDFAANKLGLQDKKLKSFITLWNVMPVGYGMLSLHAMEKINYFLLKGFIYTEAVLLAQLPSIFGNDTWKVHEPTVLNQIKDVIAENRYQKKILSIVNGLIAFHKNENNNRRDLKYKLSEIDKQKIAINCKDAFGTVSWKDMSLKDQEAITQIVEKLFQSYFEDEFKRINSTDFCTVEIDQIQYQRNRNTFFYRLPRLEDTFKEYLVKNFNFELKDLECIYHPSDINIYPPALSQRVKDLDGNFSEYVLLGSPKIGAFKNPMAMRTLHELRRLVNHLIVAGTIDPDDTRVVVEIARELNDNNKRWAIETWQRQREEENKAFAEAIQEILQVQQASNDDIDKVRVWFEQKDDQKFGETFVPLVPEGKKGKDYDLDWRRNKRDDLKRIMALKTMTERYRLWQEQKCVCLYTGKIITLTELLSEQNVFEVEHTIPRSISFDNSLANRTICEKNYNRNIKNNQIPSQLHNYSEILVRLKPWEELVERIKLQINFWQQKSKKAQIKEDKDDAIRQKHLWQMDLDYWQNKVGRFKMQEVTTSFRNSQLVDTQIVTKYAFHFLKTVFNKVDVQKGSITADFRKIFEIQPKIEAKERSLHSHHAVDASVLTFIPIASKRDEILRTYYEHEEKGLGSYHVKPYPAFSISHINQVVEGIVVSNRKRDRATNTAKKKLPNGYIATGTSIRGQLHQESFYGAIKLIKKDENGKFMSDENGWIFEQIKYVIRKEFVFKNNDQSPGFKNLDDLESQIVDKSLFLMIKDKVDTEFGGDFKKALQTGIKLVSKKGVAHKIRHVRVFVKSIQSPLKIKKHSHQSTKPLCYLDNRDHKKSYFASNGENYAILLYQWLKKDKKGIPQIKNGFPVFERDFKIISLMDLTKMNSSLETDDNLYAILKRGDKVIFYQNSLDELPRLSDKEIIRRLYVVKKFAGRQITFDYHLDSRDDKQLLKDYPASTIFKVDEKGKQINYGGRGTSGFTENIFDVDKNLDTINRNKPWPRLLYSMEWFNFAAEGYHFIMLPDGKIKWMIS